MEQLRDDGRRFHTFGFVDARDVLGEFGATRTAQIQGLRRFVESG
jgi:hypothetical protein